MVMDIDRRFSGTVPQAKEELLNLPSGWLAAWVTPALRPAALVYTQELSERLAAYYTPTNNSPKGFPRECPRADQVPL